MSVIRKPPSQARRTSARMTSRHLGALAALAVVALSASACASASGSSGSSHGDIAIGVGVPLSGPYARAGRETVNAAKIAVAEINKAGGVDGRKVVVKEGDDQGEPQTGQAVAQKFCDDDSIVAVIGHYNSGVTIPASDVYSRCRLAQISPLSSNPEVTTRGLDNVFRVGARDDYMGPAVATYLATKTDLRRISTIDDQSSYGVGLVDQFTKKAHEQGLQILKSAAIKAGDKDFRAVLGTIPHETQVVYFGGYAADASLLAQQAKEVGLDVVIAGGDGLYDPDFLKGGQAVEGGILTASAGNPTGGAQDFLDKYSANYGQPSGYGLLEYNAARMVLQALSNVHDVNRKAVVAALRTISYEPVEGGAPIKFDDKGDNVNAQVHVFTVTNGTFQESAVLSPDDFK
ncbi:MAG: amino acid/amide transporter substrate-binding protein family [Frankiales bacterium]|nr:amino acid/amide transporter substrate-binding protein family [Frankiales bacterium]